MSPKLPSSLQATFVGALIASLLIGCCAAYSGLGVAMQQMAFGTLEASGGSDPQLARMLELQRTMAIVSVVLLVLQLATSFALALGGGIGMTGRPIARPILAAALALVVLGVMADVGVAIWSWGQMGSYVPGGPGSEEEARAIAIAGAAGMIPTACWVVLKLAAVAGAAAGLFSAEASAFYARVGPGGLAIGPRG